MTLLERPRGVALLCDSEGVILNIIHDDLGVESAGLIGKPLVEIVDHQSGDKALNLLATLRLRKVAFDWHLYIAQGTETIGLHMYGGMIDDRVLLVGTTAAPDAERYFEVLMDINNEHQNSLRQVMKELSQQLRGQALASGSEADLWAGAPTTFDELSQLNSELINSQRDLARRNRQLALLAQENARLYREAEEALRLRNEFLSSLTHDLKTPITSIKGYAQLLRRRLIKAELSDERRMIEPLNHIDAMTARLVEQIDSALDIARLQMGRTLELNRHEIDLLTVAQHVANMAAPLATRHTIEVRSERAQAIGWFDGPYIERMFSNLLSNALKYSPDGGTITIDIEIDEGAEPAAAIRICDEGIGIAEPDLPRIFEPFYRANNARDKDIKGSGIGLASVRQIVEQHGGTIDVASSEGKGTCFTIRLPLLRQQRG